MTATQIFYNGTILAQDAARPQAEAVAVQDGKIVAVGSYSELEPLISANTQRIDLARCTLIPGFNYAHVHVWKAGHLLTTIVTVEHIVGLFRRFFEENSPLFQFSAPF